ncbi:hypothetical protein PoB_002415100 [Plakobranchus ocellatus]|uniref:Uncharacterized protein n=1 Tax=Plakobranchus ocellatus TaxID=259542 RepID=A0AAV3ZT05_9GAST|nr:hypothetical protein PoB_002415100 [Plakobranchus ocellatus]
MSNSQDRKGSLARFPKGHTRGPTLHTGKAIWQDFRMCTQEVQLSTRYRQLGKTSECTRKRSNSQHEIGIWKVFRIFTQEVQLSTQERQFGKTSAYAQKRWNPQHGIGESARLRNVHTRGHTLNTLYSIRQDFRMYTQEVQLSTRDRKLGKTSECEHKMSNFQHGIGNLARVPNMYTRGATLNTL